MPYLAMTAAEMQRCGALPPKIAWMSCHFSPSGSGLTNLPRALPPGSLLILDDTNPIMGHDGVRVREELEEAVEKWDCCGVLLDLERQPQEESMAMAEKILALPCPVCVAAAYAADLDCSVFVPPVPVLQTAEEYLEIWAGREIWLDCGPAAATVTVTEKGSRMAPLPILDVPECPHFDGELCCHYRVEPSENQAVFTLFRTPEDRRRLLEEAKKYGVTKGAALWQEFCL